MNGDCDEPDCGGLCAEGKLSFFCYVGTMLVVLLPSSLQIYYGIVPNVWGAVIWGPMLYFILINMVLRFSLRADSFQIAIRASFLGMLQAAGLLVMLFAPGIWRQLGCYVNFMAFFHYSEFLAIAWSNPRSLSVGSFLLNHSVQYAIAGIASWAEFLLEVYFLPDFKRFGYLWLSGVLLCVCGEIVRKTAIVTASKNFTHLVRYRKVDDHQLITHGIYAYTRHPSYAGWFWWSIGTQLVLFNPICTILYTLVSWKFFHDRILMEEITLLNFFGSEYRDYQKKVPTGLPFINGFLQE